MAQNAADSDSRAYILVQLPEALNADDKDQKTAADFCQSIGKPPTIAELTKERLRRAGAKISAANPGLSIDVGFRVYKLATSNLKIWAPGSDLEPDLVSAIDNVVEGRSEDDLLVELLLKQGIDLAEPVMTCKISGRAVHAFGGGVLVVCLGEVTSADAESLADGIVDWIGTLSPPAPTTVFFKDSGFENDQAKTNVAAILEQRLDDQLLKVRSV
jgi:adenine-specific DNA-methyltransferase